MGSALTYGFLIPLGLVVITFQTVEAFVRDMPHHLIKRKSLTPLAMLYLLEFAALIIDPKPNTFGFLRSDIFLFAIYPLLFIIPAIWITANHLKSRKQIEDDHNYVHSLTGSIFLICWIIFTTAAIFFEGTIVSVYR